MKILILGGLGFLGQALRATLSGHDVFTFDPSPGGRGHFQGSILRTDDLSAAMKGVDIVVNLVGLTPLRAPKKVTYREIHVEGVKNIIDASKVSGVRRIVHISALGADRSSDIEYIQTKGEGEELVMSSGLDRTVVRPAIIVDSGNELIRLAAKTSFTCVFPDIPARMQPVYRGDAVKIIAMAVDGKIKEDVIDTAGPDVLTVFQTAKSVYRKKGFPCAPFPFGMFKPAVTVLGALGLFGLSSDQVKMFELDITSGSNTAERYIKLTRFEDWLSSSKL